jgi:hypothetical protein
MTISRHGVTVTDIVTTLRQHADHCGSPRYEKLANEIDRASRSGHGVMSLADFRSWLGLCPFSGAHVRLHRCGPHCAEKV